MSKDVCSCGRQFEGRHGFKIGIGKHLERNPLHYWVKRIGLPHKRGWKQRREAD